MALCLNSSRIPRARRREEGRRVKIVGREVIKIRTNQRMKTAVNKRMMSQVRMKVKVKKGALQFYFMLRRPPQHGSLILALKILQ